MKYIYSYFKKSRHIPATFAVLGANPWVTRAIQKLMFRKMHFSLAATCNASRILLANVTLQKPTFRRLRFSMFRNTPCFQVSMLQSALPLSSFAFRTRGSGPQPLGSHCSPLARGSLGTPGALSEPLPSARARVGSRATFLHISRHMRALD